MGAQLTSNYFIPDIPGYIADVNILALTLVTMASASKKYLPFDGAEGHRNVNFDRRALDQASDVEFRTIFNEFDSGSKGYVSVYDIMRCRQMGKKYDASQYMKGTGLINTHVH